MKMDDLINSMICLNFKTEFYKSAPMIAQYLTKNNGSKDEELIFMRKAFKYIKKIDLEDGKIIELISYFILYFQNNSTNTKRFLDEFKNHFYNYLKHLNSEKMNKVKKKFLECCFLFDITYLAEFSLKIPITDLQAVKYFSGVIEKGLWSDCDIEKKHAVNLIIKYSMYRLFDIDIVKSKALSLKLSKQLQILEECEETDEVLIKRKSLKKYSSNKDIQSNYSLACKRKKTALTKTTLFSFIQKKVLYASKEEQFKGEFELQNRDNPLCMGKKEKKLFYKKEFEKQMKNKNHYAGKRITDMTLFPPFVIRGNLVCLFKSRDWLKAEEYIFGSPFIARMLINLIYNKVGRDEACCLYYRHRNLLKNENFPFWTGNDDFIYTPPNSSIKDGFKPMSVLKDESKADEYLNLKDLDFEREQVIWITKTNLNSSISLLKQSFLFGIDCEFYNVFENKEIKQHVSIMQIATRDNVFIFDCIELLNDPLLKSFIVEFVENPDYQIIAHTFRSDCAALKSTFCLDNLSPTNITDINRQRFIDNHALSSLVEVFLAKKLCKYEQIGPWIRRPLKLTQIHYAALDSIVLLKLQDIISANSSLTLNRKMFYYKRRNKPTLTLEEIAELKKLLDRMKHTDNEVSVTAKLHELGERLQESGYKILNFTEECEDYDDFMLYQKRVEQALLLCSKNPKKEGKERLYYKIKNKRLEDQISEVISLLKCKSQYPNMPICRSCKKGSIFMFFAIGCGFYNACEGCAEVVFLNEDINN